MRYEMDLDMLEKAYAMDRRSLIMEFRDAQQYADRMGMEMIDLYVESTNQAIDSEEEMPDTEHETMTTYMAVFISKVRKEMQKVQDLN